jgi:hypothetical protein
MMLELELCPDAEMVKDRDRYPSPTVRLHLLARAANRLMGDQSGTRELLGQVPERCEIRFDLNVIDPVLVYALGPLPKIGLSVSELCGFRREEFVEAGTVPDWRARFRQDSPGDPPNNLESARLIACAALAAYSDLPAPEDKPWTKAVSAAVSASLSTLSQRVLESLRKSAAEGTRAGEREPVDPRLVADDVAASLRNALGLPQVPE